MLAHSLKKQDSHSPIGPVGRRLNVSIQHIEEMGVHIWLPGDSCVCSTARGYCHMLAWNSTPIEHHTLIHVQLNVETFSRSSVMLKDCKNSIVWQNTPLGMIVVERLIRPSQEPRSINRECGANASRGGTWHERHISITEISSVLLKTAITCIGKQVPINQRERDGIRARRCC